MMGVNSLKTVRVNTAHKMFEITTFLRKQNRLLYWTCFWETKETVSYEINYV